MRDQTLRKGADFACANIYIRHKLAEQNNYAQPSRQIPFRPPAVKPLRDKAHLLAKSHRHSIKSPPKTVVGHIHFYHEAVRTCDI